MVTFSFVVDDFGVKYIGKQYSYHLIVSIRKCYPVDADWNIGLYCGIKIDWKFDQPRSVDLSMPKYLPNALHEFQHPYPKIPQHVPHKWEHLNYGAKQSSKEESSLEVLIEQRRKLIQKVVVKFLYYGRTVNTTLLVVLGSILSEKSKGTTQTEAVVHQF